MSKKGKWIVVLVVFLVVAAGIYAVFASFNGSIIKKVIMTYRTKAYIAEHYAKEPYEVEFCRYDFKCAGYFCYVQSTQSEDTRFQVYEDTEERLTDDYDRCVTQRENTIRRLMMEMDDYAEEYIQKGFGHRTSLVICDCSNDLNEDSLTGLELDMPFDAKTFPIKAELTVWVETAGDKPSWEELAERLRELEQYVRDEIPCIEYYSLCIQDRYIEYVEEDDEWKPISYDSEVSVYSVPEDVITGDQLESYLLQERTKQEKEKDDTYHCKGSMQG